MVLINSKNTEGRAYSIGKIKHPILDTLFRMPEVYPRKYIQQITRYANLKLKGDTRTGYITLKLLKHTEGNSIPKCKRVTQGNSEKSNKLKEDPGLRGEGTHKRDPEQHIGRTKENHQCNDNKIKEMENFKK